MILQCVIAVEFLDITPRDNSIFPDANSIGKYSIQKNGGKQGCKQDFPIVITHAANFSVCTSDCFVHGNPAMITMWSSTIFTFMEVICLQLMLEQILISFLQNLLSIVFPCA